MGYQAEAAQCEALKRALRGWTTISGAAAAYGAEYQELMGLPLQASRVRKWIYGEHWPNNESVPAHLRGKPGRKAPKLEEGIDYIWLNVGGPAEDGEHETTQRLALIRPGFLTKVLADMAKGRAAKEGRVESAARGEAREAAIEEVIESELVAEETAGIDALLAQGYTVENIVPELETEILTRGEVNAELRKLEDEDARLIERMVRADGKISLTIDKNGRPAWNHVPRGTRVAKQDMPALPEALIAYAKRQIEEAGATFGPGAKYVFSAADLDLARAEYTAPQPGRSFEPQKPQKSVVEKEADKAMKKQRRLFDE